MIRDRPWQKNSREPVFYSARAKRVYQGKVAATNKAKRARGERVGPVDPPPTKQAFTVAESGCWEWRGKRTRAGYGIVLGQLAHRLVYKTYKADIGSGLVLMHTCDNRPCVNPDHLVPGTQAQNVADMHEKGRARPFGQKQKLTPAQRAEIAERRGAGESPSALAAEFGVSSGYVSSLGEKSADSSSGSRLDEKQRREIAARYLAGEDANELCDEYGISRPYVSSLHRRYNGGVGRVPKTPTAGTSQFDVEQIAALRAQGWTHQMIANHIGASKSHVGRLLRGYAGS